MNTIRVCACLCVLFLLTTSKSEAHGVRASYTGDGLLTVIVQSHNSTLTKQREIEALKEALKARKAK